MSISGVFNTSEGYHKYIRGCSVHQRDAMSTLEGYHEHIRGYHDTCGGIP